MRSGSVVIVLALGLVLGPALSGCGRAPWASAEAPSASQPADAGDDGGYRAPPRLTKAVRTADGHVTLSGLGLADAAVRLSLPGGPAQDVQADASGDWSISVAAPGPAIYGLSQDAGGQRDQAQGYLLVLPGGGPAAAELRSGAGARTMAPDPPVRLRIDAVDLDGSGAAVVSGWTGAGQSIRVLVDGAAVDEGTAGATGRFSLALPKPLPAGAHVIQLVAAGGAVQAKLDVAAPAPFGGVLHAARRGADWRVDWLTPAGGVQTTFLFAPDSSALQSSAPNSPVPGKPAS